jgi:ubiquinone/menaquinone biosynthesis C-methylase UbiE
VDSKADVKGSYRQRLEEAEWLDLGYGTPAEVADSLAEVARINQYLGGLRALTKHLYPRIKALAKAGRAVSVLDVGTGSGDIPAMLFRWAKRERIQVQTVAVDLSPRHLDFARGQVGKMPTVQLLGADALQLPMAAKSIDFVISSLFLHHLGPEVLVNVLKSAKVVARHGIVMNDLVRGWMPAAAFRLVKPIFARNPLTWHDGSLSIRRAYQPAELLSLAREAGLNEPVVHTHWPWRMTLTSDLAKEVQT